MPIDSRRVWLVAALLAASARGTEAQDLPGGSLRVPLVRQATSYSCGAEIGRAHV